MIDAEIKDLINDALTRCQKLLRDNAAKVKVMAELLLANETIYSEDINLVMAGKSTKEIAKAINERKEKQTQTANDERIDALIEQINPLLNRSLEIAKLHFAENLVSEEDLKTLEKHCDMAREYIRQTGKIPAIPTIDHDSLTNYADLVKIEKPVVTEVKTEAATTPAKKKTAAKKTTTASTAKRTTKAKVENDGNNTEVKANDEVPTHE